MTDLRGRTAIVTGGGVGIGKAIALGLARAGARVAITFLSHEPDEAFLEELRSNGAAEPIARRVDVTDAEAVEEFVSVVDREFGGLDILVNNAGGLLARHSVAEMEPAFWNQVISLNLTSAFLLTHAALRILRDGGRVVNIASLAGHNGGGNGATAYATAKAGMFGFTRGLAKELGPRSITVNAVAPGLILDTPFHETFTPPEAQKSAVGSIAIGRAGTPDDVAGPVIWLCSEHGSFVTGEVININGGQYFS